ncbi:putative D-tyrosyl-tRNA(Tyr) deacylase 1-like [Apostichopus japonicus]|uniref:D-aminoacyl-tRNA deacylase n=1 Tax=Stichopus japonicus TaxID=307972 RepID=A0A2G8JG36_STIJA|nr:putative D-tyrosyl-tRNA(Tyr) deacylase 1-like [Apostichopus japonicus]
MAKDGCKSVKDKNFEILCVSQFTLYSVMKGNKPDFHNAMPGEESKQYYDDFLAILRKGYNSENVKDGKFAAYMQVHIQNDGPVTIQLEAVPDIHFQIPESRVGPRAASGSKTPVAVVRGQPQDRTIEKATSYIAIFTSAFNGETSKQEEFLKEQAVLCGFSGFLPQGFSIFLENEDLEQIRIRCPAVEDMSIKELRDHVEELKSNEASASPVPLTKPTRAMEELILQLSRLLSS